MTGVTRTVISVCNRDCDDAPGARGATGTGSGKGCPGQWHWPHWQAEMAASDKIQVCQRCNILVTIQLRLSKKMQLELEKSMPAPVPPDELASGKVNFRVDAA